MRLYGITTSLRDIRGSLWRLVIIAMFTVLAVAQYVGMASFSENLRRGVSAEIKTIAGADLVISSPRPLDAKQSLDLTAFSLRRSKELTYLATLRPPEGGNPAQVQVHVVDSSFPLYGHVGQPFFDALAMLRPDAKGMVIERTLAENQHLRIGDHQVIGDKIYTVVAIVDFIPGQFPAAFRRRSNIFIRTSEDVPADGSSASETFREYLELRPGLQAAGVVSQLRKNYPNSALTFETLEQASLIATTELSKIDIFLRLVVVLSFTGGSIAQFVSLYFYLSSKFRTTTILQYLGATRTSCLLFLYLQLAVVVVLTTIAGAALGVIIQALIPTYFQDLLPIAPVFFICWSVIAKSLILSIGAPFIAGIVVYFRFRQSAEARDRRYPADARDLLIPISIGASFYVAIALFIGSEPETFGQEAMFILAVAGLIGVLYCATRLLVVLANKTLKHSPSKLFTYGLSKLNGAPNQAHIAVLTIGFATFALVLTSTLRSGLLANSARQRSAALPEFVVANIPGEKVDKIREALHKDNMCRSVDCVPVAEADIKAVHVAREGWGAASPARRASSLEGRRILATFSEDSEEDKPTADYSQSTGVLPIHVQRNMLGSDLRKGDRITLLIAGVPLRTEVSGYIDSGRGSSSFFPIVRFQSKVIAEAPISYVITGTLNAEHSAKEAFEAALAIHPNSIVIDLLGESKAISATVAKIASVSDIFVALMFFTGMIVLVESLVSTYQQRQKDAAIMRILGADNRYLLSIHLSEMIILGTLAIMIGCGIAGAVGLAVSRSLLHIPFTLDIQSLIRYSLYVIWSVVLVGSAFAFSACYRIPLAYLHGED